MVDIKCLEEIPTRVMEVLKIFLAASSRGEKAVLVLETQNKAVTTKYRSVDTVVGMPAPLPSTSTRRQNPARVRRSRLRLEEFAKKKLEEKSKREKQQTSGSLASSTATNRLVMELDKKETMPVHMETGLPSPIVQLDGEVDKDIDTVARFSFESTYHEDDVTELLSETFPESEVSLTLESRVKVAPLSNREIFVIRLKTTKKKLLAWPRMENDQADVFENVKKLK